MDEFYVHTVDVETFAGAGQWGDTYEPHNAVPCFIEEKRQLVRSQTGEQVVSETTIYTSPANADWFTPDSRVTFRGKTSIIISRSLHDSGGLDLPDHVEVAL